MTLHRKRGRSSPQRAVKVHGDLDPRHWKMKKLLPWRCYVGDSRCVSVAYPGRTLPLSLSVWILSSNLLLVAFGIPSSSHKTLRWPQRNAKRTFGGRQDKVSSMIEYRTSLAVFSTQRYIRCQTRWLQLAFCREDAAKPNGS